MSAVHMSMGHMSAGHMSAVHMSAVHMSAVPMSAVHMSAMPMSAGHMSVVPMSAGHMSEGHTCSSSTPQENRRWRQEDGGMSPGAWNTQPSSRKKDKGDPVLNRGNS